MWPPPIPGCALDRRVPVSVFPPSLPPLLPFPLSPPPRTPTHPPPTHILARTHADGLPSLRLRMCVCVAVCVWGVCVWVGVGGWVQAHSSFATSFFPRAINDIPVGARGNIRVVVLFMSSVFVFLLLLLRLLLVDDRPCYALDLPHSDLVVGVSGKESLPVGGPSQRGARSLPGTLVVLTQATGSSEFRA